MPEEHLELPFYREEFERKKTGRGPRVVIRENTKQYYTQQLSAIEEIKKDFALQKEKFSKYFDPDLIFKIRINQSVDEDGFIQFLGACGIKVISTSPDKQGYWITLAEDEDLQKVERRLKEYCETKKLQTFNCIEPFEQIPVEDKIGEELRAHPLEPGETAHLDVEIWRMEDKRIDEFLSGKGEQKGFEFLLNEKGGKITDRLKTTNLCLLRVRLNKEIFDDIKTLNVINRIDRPPKPYFTAETISIPLEKLDVKEPPNKNATAIGILDSGILASHPLLEKATGDEIAVSMLGRKEIREDKPQDDVGHGTKVAGIAVYGDLKQCILEKKFSPEVWILSAKVMYRKEGPTGEICAEYDETELLEHQLEKAVTYFVENFKNCRIVNISFGNRASPMFRGQAQYSLAVLIDELAKKHNLIFIISAGNISENKVLAIIKKYPQYFIDETKDVKIIDPASSAYALTVGSIVQEYGPFESGNENSEKDIAYSPANKKGYPSPFTRVGPGYREMIKPDLVEEGGNILITPSFSIAKQGGNLIVLNPDWLKEGRLFSMAYGTSLSAPKVANLTARLCNQYPNFSSNMIKALILASAEIPKDRPSPLDSINYGSRNKDLLHLLKIYGCGKPNLNTASFSSLNHVVLKAENSIQINGIHLYHFYLSDEFLTVKGDRQISIVLTYDPPVLRKRRNYMGVNMEFHLFKNSSVTEIIDGYKSILKDNNDETEEAIDEENEDGEGVVPEQLKIKEIKLKPGVTIRKRSLHQKGIILYKRKTEIDISKPLVLAVINQDRWIRDREYKQNYAVVVTVKHQAEIDLYNQIRQRIAEKIRIRA
ncbi:MAG: S8 family peptidase [Candidatus Omnitrophota bacterium]